MFILTVHINISVYGLTFF